MINVPLTIIIPIEGKHNTLVNSLQTCIKQSYSKLSIIVSDNSNVDVADVVNSFSDSRIKYIRPGQRLGMSEHWEFALSHVKEGYLTILGDGDGFLPEAIAQIAKSMKGGTTRAFTWKKIEYYSPDYILPERKNWLQLPLDQEMIEVNAIEQLIKVSNFQAEYNSLPCLCNSFVKASDIEAIKKKSSGIFFNALNPDIYSGIALSTILDSYLYSSMPLSVNDVSFRSRWLLNTQADKSSETAQFFYEKTKFQIHETLTDCPSPEILIADTFLQALQVLKSTDIPSLDYSLLVQKAAANAANKSIEHYDEIIAALDKICKKNNVALTGIDLRQSFPHKSQPALPLYGYHEPSQLMVFDVSRSRVENVTDAAEFCAKVIRFKNLQSKLFSQCLKISRPEQAIAIMSLADGAPVKLHLGCGENFLESYINIDYSPSEHSVMQVRAQYFANIADLDFPPNSLDEIRLHHVFEHFNRVIALALLIKWQNWLKVGGRIYIETPDMEGSARAIINGDFRQKMASIRHLEGDQADRWAYHIGQWFPERFIKTYKSLGFDNVEIETALSAHIPPLHNVHARAFKKSARNLEDQLDAADKLLWDSIVADAERPIHEVWRSQLRGFLLNEETPAPNFYHPGMSDGKPMTEKKFKNKRDILGRIKKYFLSKNHLSKNQRRIH